MAKRLSKDAKIKQLERQWDKQYKVWEKLSSKRMSLEYKYVDSTKRKEKEAAFELHKIEQKRRRLERMS